jgi:hypothetical protein
VSGIAAGDGDPRHGTTNGYGNLKCRCADCRRAWTAWFKESRVRRNARLTPDDPRHGQVSTYFNHACRCVPCRAARSAYEQARRSA